MPRKKKQEPTSPPFCAAGADPSLLTGALGLEGWSDLEPVVLAALASREPMLLVGSHGTAKSFLLERLAESLGLTYRFYNASLVNYDDLVGIPIPDESRRELHYIATPTSIWDAEVVFVDELNRTRPDLQNKLFPLIHERRVQGVDLPRLRHRWAAMNPPPALDDEEDDRPEYLGAEPLDPALADRFVFLIEVPQWRQLSREAKERVLFDQFAGRHEFEMSIPDLIARAERVLGELERTPPRRLADYLITVEPLLAAKGVHLSTRRMTMLMRSILAIHAARVALHLSGSPVAVAEGVDWCTSALLALQHGDPRPALTGRSHPAQLLEIHQHAWKLSGLDKDDPWRELLAIGDPVERFAIALALGGTVKDDDLGTLILDAVGSQEPEAHQVTVALACYLAVCAERAVPATVVETLARHAQRALVPVTRELKVHASRAGHAQVVGRILASRPSSADGSFSHVRDRYLSNLLHSLLPDGYEGTSPDEVTSRFDRLWDRLALESNSAVRAR